MINEGITDSTAKESECLRVASVECHRSTVQLLLQTNANPTDKNSDALVRAVSRGHVEIVKDLLADGWALPELCFSAFWIVFGMEGLR